MRIFLPSLLLFSLLNLVGCAGGFDDENVKDYKLFLDDENPDAQERFISFINEYNDEAGLQVLQYTESQSDSNSTVFFTKGLERRDGKVGWGQWIRKTKQQGGVPVPGQKIKRTHIYSMRIELDYDYFYNRLHKDDEAAQTDIKKLLCHEVGHGLQMNHDEKNEKNVMFPDISGKKNFTDYFERVRHYMND